MNENLWEMFNQSKGIGNEQDAQELAVGAALLFNFYSSLVTAGFDTEAALFLTGKMLENAG